MKHPTFAASKAGLWPFLLVMVVLAALCPVAYGGVQVSATPMPHCVVLGTGEYDVGSVAQLTVAPEVGWQFDHWEGDVPADQTNDNPLSLQVTTNATVKAVMAAAADPKAGWFNGGTVVAWGWNQRGEASVPVGLSNVVAVAAGVYHTVALKADGTVVAWGDNSYGQTSVPTGLSNVVSVAAGGSHTVVLKGDGTVAAWGENWYGETSVPAGLSNMSAVAAGYEYTVVLKGDGTVAAWGYSAEGETSVPAGLSNVVSVAAGWSHTVALKGDGTVVAWGYNLYGETSVPAGLSGVVAVAAGGSHTVVLKGDGTVVAWGFNADGETNVPAGLSNVVAVAGGGYHTVALKADGTVVAWGNTYGGETSVPAGLSNVVSVAARLDSLALKAGSLEAQLQSAATASIVVETWQSLRLAPRFVLATGYQWYRNGAPVAGATNAAYYVAAATIGDAGSYQLLAVGQTNALLSPPSRVVVLVAGTPRVLVNGQEVFGSTVSADSAAVQITTSIPGGQLYYTLDGSDPGFDSTAYTGPFTITQSAVVRAIAYSSDFSQVVEADPVVIQVVPTYAITTQVTGNGAISQTPSQARYLMNSAVTLTAQPASGWRFARWEGDLSGAYPAGVLVMTTNKAVTAVFEAIPLYPLVIHSGGGTITGNDGSPYLEGTSVTVQATALPGWTFAGWTGAVESTNSQISVVMDQAQELTAVFTTTIQTAAQGNGHIALNPVTGPYAYGDAVQVTPVPDSGYYLGAWGGVAFGFPKVGFDLVVTTNAPLISAIFQALPTNKFTVVGLAGPGGRVNSSPGTNAYLNGQSVTLTAVPQPGYQFVQWSGTVSSTNNPLVIVADANKVLTASFTQEVLAPVNLSVTAVNGQVSRVPDLPVYELGTEVELRAQPDTGYTFVSWQGDATGTNASVWLTLDGDKNVVAVFKALFQLGTGVQGQGTVLVTPQQDQYVDGDTVQVTANPAVGYGFVRWSGDSDSLAQQLTVVMDGNKQFTANFAQLGTLTTYVQGHGQIVRTPDKPSYLPTESVTLTAVPDTGYRFVGWAGDLSGTNLTVALTVQTAARVVAVFADATPPQVAINSPVAGTVSDERFVLSGTLTDNEGVVSAWWEWDGVRQGNLTNNFNLGGLRFHRGLNTLRVVALDAAGNQGSAQVQVTWTPLRTLSVGEIAEVQEGQKAQVPLWLASAGEVGSLSFTLVYDTNYLCEPELTWSGGFGASLNLVNTNVAGEVTATLAVPAGTTLPGGLAQVAQVQFQTRSVPSDVQPVFGLQQVQMSDGNGQALVFGTDEVDGTGSILMRRFLGDINGNNRLDVGDAALMQQLLTGLEEKRPWDDADNDLNGSGALDPGDVVMVLSVVVGINPQPQSAEGASPGGRREQGPTGGLAPQAVLVADRTVLNPGDAVTVRVVLTNLPTTILGASLVVDYPSDALQLTARTNGALVPAGTLVAWNERQAGHLPFAASSATAWPATNGVLVQLTFTATTGIGTEANWPVTVRSVETSADGYDNLTLPTATLTVAPAVQLQITSFGKNQDGHWEFHFASSNIGSVLIESSYNLRDWQPVVTLPAGTLSYTLTDPGVPGQQARFFRASGPSGP